MNAAQTRKLTLLAGGDAVSEGKPMKKVYVSMALAFMAVIVVSLWHGISRVHLADGNTAVSLALDVRK